MVSGTRALHMLWLKLRGQQGSGPKGVDDLCFHMYGGIFSFFWASRLGFGPLGWDMGLQAEIWAWRLGGGGCGGGGEGEGEGGENSPYV